MSLKVLAQQLAAQGRGPDTMLVHMAPSEVASLQEIAKAHGGSLTVHPETGLPEAGFLSSILPMVAGGLLAATGVGAPLAALMVGGGTGLISGDWKKGLTAGLGAFGGAGLAQGLGSVGAGAANAASGTAMLSPAEAASMGVQQAATTATPTLSNIGAGIGQVMQHPMIAGKAALAAAPKYTASAGLAGLMGGMAQSPKMPKDDKNKDMFYLTSYNPGTYNPNFGQPGEPYFLNQGYGPGQYVNQYPTGMARGGAVPSKIEPPSMDQFYQTLLKPQANPMGGYAASLVQGPGDGVSDSVPAHIDGQQPAALSRGEFVIPAKIVAEIGNGSSDAGADKLRAMMQRVMAHRQKSADAGEDTGAAMELPA